MSSGNTGVEEGKLFVGGLSWDTTTEGLTQYFSSFGEVAEATIMTDSSTKKPRGFGFVTFKDPSSCTAVLSGGPHTLDGKKIDPKPATNKQTMAPNRQPTNKVFVGGLDMVTTADSLKAAFVSSLVESEVVDAEVKSDKATNRSRGFGFVTFNSSETVDKLLKERTNLFLNVDGKDVEVKRAEQKGAGQHQYHYQQQYGGAMYDRAYGRATMGAGSGQYSDPMYQASYQQRGQYQQQQQYEGGYYGYGGQGAGYGSQPAAAGYGAASYNYSQSAGQQPVSSYPDQSYGAAGYGTSRNDSASYGQQQYSAAGYQQQGYGNTSGNTASRGQQPQNSYGYGSGHGMR